ncbi:DDE-type integrase/transposase/recombinase [Sporosarcina beigongshangi]|uniref:DDE-type integrase/transposase/recombinase n=1 Tax=Sporosarcina beigongshangi TaxID=2782538 RepID=UPI002ACDF3F2|nr:DDE-type integrase/transposase/recombinase [Sporosarcina beigongshangi]
MNRRKMEEKATNRYQLIAPLLQEGLDPQKAKQLRVTISKESGLSERTLRRYIAQFREEGFEGLKQKQYRTTKGDTQDLILDHAILLRREVPSRSISTIIQILEWEGIVKKDTLKRSTLQEKLAKRGYSSRQMRMYHETSGAVRRFQRKHRNQLWHSDIKYGPYLPIGPDGKKKQVYMVALLDDATRMPLHVSFYPMLDARCVEEAFREAIRKHGVPESVYFDNGKQYRNKWMTRTCAKLGIRLLYARPYSPESTGKVERFNRTFNSFLEEARLEDYKTLDKLNSLLEVWISECYLHKGHSALKDQMSPFAAFRSDTQPIRMISAEELATAFLHAETRKVDKSGCISFQDKKYEVGINFVGCRVEITYDPLDLTELTVDLEGYPSWKAKELVIGERAGKRPSLPEHMTKAPATSSRLLKAAKGQADKRKSMAVTPAVSYRNLGKRGESHV